jgi:hypothetical protein
MTVETKDSWERYYERERTEIQITDASVIKILKFRMLWY